MRKDDALQARELYCDNRLGVKRWSFGKPKDAEMRIPDSALDTVCFICVPVQGEHGASVFFIGTGFFISLPTSIPNKYFRYLVTARHVIDNAKAAGYSEFFVRLNTKDGNSIIASLPDGWLYPENPAADVAVLPIGIGEPSVKYADIPYESFATDEAIREYGIGIGDDLIMVGLFAHRWGHQRNIPIVRSGIIASMPDEPFVDEDGHLYNAYLVEMRSIGGLSGSPVFVFLDGFRTYPDVEEFNLDHLRWEIRLIGVIRGHWDLYKEDFAGDVGKLVIGEGEIERLNTGIAQVTPIQEVLAILNREEFVKERERLEAEARKKSQPTLDANLPEKRDDVDLGITKEGFEDALKKVFPRPSESESGSDET